MSNQQETFGKTMIVVLAVCLVCSIIVAGAAVGLRPLQIENKAIDKQNKILDVAGLTTNKTVSEIFNSNIETKLVDLATGEFVSTADPITYDQRKAAKDPETSIKLSAEDNIAKIGRRANLATVYLVSNDQGELQRIILPVHGAGLWSTMYAFVAIQPDGNTIEAITYYEQGETPGLGGEVQNPRWTNLFKGKELFDENGDPAIEIVKGQAPAGSKHKIDGLSGATLTSVGVEHTFTFWLGEQGFGPFLSKVREGALNNG
ncbi:Na(+)-translocating NADH-quinone reductase subunit C [Psychromonas sp. 14N.309.X.WAT.B.A12]|uniref:Na(+)-translocating NADH-quinone reductase subunit C n=1 Tax=unclassified Psychromonas TaxID=2614957 RepID=UPI0025AFEFEB|nr:Na(+)-translocating NADH-quinone reductase subunit C [Psychromonas sp. 14N.309.X.WAT.B.A12]MDN2663915.1 Na(+)-translocating NADH-quinone reductase subunit C [Psychromonas sp. 14N.309.X.WAT.B.A12]